MTNEPAITVGTITAVATAILGLLAVFGFGLDSKQSAAILAVIVALAPIVSGLITRSKVTPAPPGS